MLGVEGGENVRQIFGDIQGEVVADLGVGDPRAGGRGRRDELGVGEAVDADDDAGAECGAVDRRDGDGLGHEIFLGKALNARRENTNFNAMLQGGRNE